jgi:hypothetical protein
MAKTKSKSKSAWVQVGAPVAPTQPEQAQPERKARKRRARKAQYSIGGKPARGLTETPADFARATQRLTVGQFASMAAWFTHCAAMAQERADTFAAQAQDALAHPERYGRAKRQAKVATLQAQLDVLVAALVARGMSAPEVAALTASLDKELAVEIDALDAEDGAEDGAE